MLVAGVALFGSVHAQAQQFCDQMKRVRDASPTFASLKGLSASGAPDVVMVMLPGAVDCAVLDADKASPRMYSCRWLDPGEEREKALREGRQLAESIARCLGGEKVDLREGKDEIISVYPIGKPAPGKSALVFRVITYGGDSRASVRQDLNVFITDK